MNISEFANSSFMYTLGVLIAVFITIQSVAYMLRSYRAGLAAGIERKKMNRVIRSSCVFTLVPSTAILLGLITMSGGLGVPLAWIRLSVIGAVQYELITAAAAAQATGLPSLLLSGMTAEAFVSIATVMTICILSGPLFNLFFLKKYTTRIKRMQEKDNRWGKLVISSLFMGMICTFIGNPLIALRTDPGNGWIAIAVMVVSALFMFLCELAVKKLKQKWLEGFALPVSMIAGMCFAAFVGGLV